MVWRNLGGGNPCDDNSGVAREPEDLRRDADETAERVNARPGAERMRTLRQTVRMIAN
jgi:hypothetical protein